MSLLRCILVDDDPITNKVNEELVKRCDFLSLNGIFNNPLTALNYITSTSVDVIFLDVEMPEISGIEFIQTVRQQKLQVILVTSHKEFAVDAYNLNVTDYIVKPTTFSRFYEAACKARMKFINHKTEIDNDNFFVKTGNRIIRIKLTDILWIEALGDYLTIYTQNEKFVIHSTMQSISERLPTNDYIRIHRSYIVKISNIESIEDNAVTFSNKLFPIGRSYKETVFKRLNIS